MRAIAYSIFGYERQKPENCFDHHNYVQSFIINVRLNRILYPNWVTVLNIDAQSYSPNRKVYDWLQDKGLILINIQPDDEPLTKAMLWRLKCVLSYKHPEWLYSHVLCRDTDSPSTYREAQAVQQWILEDKTAHCITDSISHTIPMMGGMIGFKPGDLGTKMGLTADKAWAQMMDLGRNINFKRKGADQDFLCQFVYPKVADSATEHFILGMKQTVKEGDGRHYSIADIEVPNVDPKWKCTNDFAGHIGAAGYYPITLQFLKHSDPYRAEYAEIARNFPKLFLTDI